MVQRVKTFEFRAREENYFILKITSCEIKGENVWIDSKKLANLEQYSTSSLKKLLEISYYPFIYFTLKINIYDCTSKTKEGRERVCTIENENWRNRSENREPY